MIGFNIRSNIHIPQLSVTVDLLQIHDSGSSWCLPRLQAVDVPHLAGLHLCLRLQRSDHRHHHHHHHHHHHIHHHHHHHIHHLHYYHYHHIHHYHCHYFH